MTTTTITNHTGELILLLDPQAQAGRTGHRFKVKDARRVRSIARDQLGNTRADTPSVASLLRAAKAISALLYDATEGDAKLTVELGQGEDIQHVVPGVVLSTLFPPR